MTSISTRTLRIIARILALLAVTTVLVAGCDQVGTDGKATRDTYAIRLKARTFVPEPGIDAALTRNRAKDENTTHVMVQFTTIPGMAARGKLTEFGIRLLDPVPEHAFFAGLTSSEDRLNSVMKDFPTIRWIGPIEPRDKVSPGLQQGHAPLYTRREGKDVELIVLFFGDVDRDAQEKVLRDLNVKIVDRLQAVNGWLIVAPEARIFQLAQIDGVKWVEEGPPPGETDNDGARGASGINADGVNPPSLYDLSGTGVVVMHREPMNASLQHGDLSPNIVLADPPVPVNSRSVRHVESVANGAFDAGEAIYIDMDDSTTVTIGDWRATANGTLAASTFVAPGDADIGTATFFFQALERFNESVADGTYTNGEAIYRDNDGNSLVSVGDTRLTASGGFAAGSIVALGNADIGIAIYSFPTDPHYHPTHVAGTLAGTGGLSVAGGGSANQWKGMAPQATIRSYRTDGLGTDYADAAINNVVLSSNSWGFSHMHQQIPPSPGYDVTTGYYDSTISGRQSDGMPSGLARQISIFGSSGNQGYPERHTESMPANGLYDNGESIIEDYDDSGTVSAGDGVALAPVPAIGTPLVNFANNERHGETVNTGGTYNSGEGIYIDADASGTVSPSDTRVIAFGGFAAGSAVAGGNADVGNFLRQFRLWGNVRVPNSAKDTIVVGNVTSNTKVPDPSTSRGPTLDGRIKPEIVGPGSQAGGDGGITSTWPRNTYNTIAGTSMSTPATAGGGALVTQWYRTALLAAGPSPATLRALLVHSAEDLTAIPHVPGVFTGPDFAFGYGRERVDEAASLVPHHLTGTAAVPGDIDYAFTVGAVTDLKVTLAWDDPAWTANATPSAVTGMLQNDLDLILIGPDGTQYTPWLLNPATPNVPATRTTVAAAMPIPAAARDRRNTIEQVVVPNAQPGVWTVRVTASTLNLPSQPYTLVSEFIRPQDSPTAGLTPVDVWMHDNAGDLGSVPSTGTMYVSPDVWNANSNNSAIGHENPEYGEVNYLFARIFNASASVAHATTIDVWIAPAAIGLAWPANFTYVGRIAVPQLAGSSNRVVGPLLWYPPNPMPSDHFCFYVRVSSPQDPITFAEGTDVGLNASSSNNIVWRNINVVNLHSETTIAFVARNIAKERAPVDIAIDVPPELLAVGKVYVELPPDYEAALASRGAESVGIGGPTAVLAFPWGLSKVRPPVRHVLTGGRVVIPGALLRPGETATIRLTFASAQQTKASYSVNVRQVVRGKVVGGILYDVRTGYAKPSRPL